MFNVMYNYMYIHTCSMGCTTTCTYIHVQCHVHRPTKHDNSDVSITVHDAQSSSLLIPIASQSFYFLFLFDNGYTREEESGVKEKVEEVKEKVDS